MRANSFTKIDDRDFNKTSLSIIKEKFKKIIKFLLKSKDDANSSAPESLF